MANNASVGGSTNTSQTDGKILLPTKDQVSNISSTLGSTGDTGGGTVLEV